MAKNMTKSIGRRNGMMDIGVAVFVILILAMIIIPLPATLLDFMLIINLALSVTILMLTLFTKTVLDFSSFPTILLITTMLRLGLNISSTRLILTEGEAGAVIDTFANLVTGSNIIIGFVIFIIIFIIQLMVVTNGAGRVSEVSARFTLDAMPGKQMSIDADLSAGLITEDQAKKRRNDLERETQFFGAMDGAMKFVKGDATAGIIITVINLVGGTLIFVLMEGMAFGDAITQFGKLTIGDGLVSQIPSLLISVASGILVTRSGSAANSFGTSVIPELFGTSKVLYLTGSVMMIFALIPGFPTLLFALVGSALGAGGYLLSQNEKTEQEAKRKKEEKSRTAERVNRDRSHEEQIKPHQVDPIAIEIGYGLIQIADEKQENNIMSQVLVIRKQVAQELGILLNPIRIRDNLQLDKNEYILKIKGNIQARGELYLDKFLLISPDEENLPFRGIATKEPSFGLDALWIEAQDREAADLRGYTVVDPLTVLVTHLKETIIQNSHQLLGRQEVKQLLEILKEKYSVVIDELIPDIMRLGEVQKVLQNLLKEHVPIIDLVTILETLADYGPTVKDSELLTEYVRQALKHMIVKPHLDEQGRLHVVTVHPNTEEVISRSIQKSSAGSIPILQGDTVTRLFDSVNQIHQQLTAHGVPHVLLVSPKNRPAMKNLLAYNFSDLAVLSLNEVPNETAIETAGLVDNIDS